MFGTTVMDIEHRLFEDKLEHLKKSRNVNSDTELSAQDLENLVE